MLVAFIGAMDSEISLIINSLENIETIKYYGYIFYKGKYKGKDVLVTKSGVGKVNMAIMATTIIERFNPDYIINIGVAGSIKEKINSTCIATSLRCYDILLPGGEICSADVVIKTSESILNEAKKLFKDSVVYGKFLTGDTFVTKIEDLHGRPTDGVVAIDMESISLAVACDRYQKEFLIIRSISDNLSSDDFCKNEFLAADTAARMALEFIENYK